MRIVVRSALLTTLVALLFAGSGRAESWDPAEVGRLVQILKQDDRGPFEAIRWFCPDGNILPPDQRCLQPGGLQHGLPKEVVRNLARKQGVYLGQVLAGASFEDFLDSGNDNSRLIQYQLEKYLYLVDDGWIFRKARFYRGAVQSEDEAAWGQKFLTFLVSKDEVVQSQFFLLRQTVKEIPHRADDDRWRFIRAQSKAIADAFPRFSNLRIKLHGHPEHKDIQAIKDFRKRYETELSTQVDEMILRLITELEAAYLPSHLQTLGRYLAHLPVSSAIRNRLQQLLEIQSASGERSAGPTLAASRIITLGADLLWTIRKDLPQVTEPSVRLTVLDLSNELETILYRHAGEWRPQTLGELLEKTYALAKAAVGCGFLEMWEWERIESSLRPSQTGMGLSWEGFMQRVDVARRTVEWGSGMVRAQYGWVVETFAKFEPLAAGFIDEWIHASLLLPLGACAGQLSGVAARFSGVASRVMGIANQQQVRGINPGVAMGRLEVMDAVLAEATFAGDKIYVLPQAPADLKPVAGLLTVTEGNLVSHVQLLARNLGIPNGVLSLQHLNSLKAFAGQKVFYAVSPRGTVLMKLAAKMTAAEKALVEARRKEGDKITVPTEKIDLEQVEPVSMKTLRSLDSGRICGPKAANLGQLKRLFPHRVVDGLVIPFGIFRKHLDQPMPGSDMSYWQFLHATFVRSKEARKSGQSEAQVEAAILESLAKLRESVRSIPLLPEFKQALIMSFNAEFGAPLGSLPVFIRSDTNMEDLKDFSGAGLNLTVFNVRQEAEIWQAIRDVWSSPYSERSYRWRQRLLLNPEQVYPSILLLPSVNVEKSGVMVTTGVVNGDPDDTMVAFNRGVGGAVEGQAAESYLLKKHGRIVLLSPSREMRYMTLPVGGGVQKQLTRLHQPVLNLMELKTLQKLATEIRDTLPGIPGIKTSGPFDVELGFKDGAVRLFQVRPYIENRRARSSEYLMSLDPTPPASLQVSLTDQIELNQRAHSP